MKKAIIILLLATGFAASAQNFEKTYPYWDEGEIWAAIPNAEGYWAIGFGRLEAEYQMFIIKTDFYGDTLEIKRFDAGNYGSGSIRAFATDLNGNHYIAPGRSTTIDLMKFSPEWELIWTKLFSPRRSIRNITLASDGNLLMSADTSNTNQVLMKTDPETNILWSAPYVPEQNYTITPSILEKGNGEIIVITTTLSDFDPIPAYSNIFTYTASGELLSTGLIDNGNGNGRVLSNAYVFGDELLGLTYTTSLSSLIRYLPDGTLLWEKPMNLPAGFYADHLIFGADSSLTGINKYEWGINNSTMLHGMNNLGDSLWTRFDWNEDRTLNFDIRLCPDAGFLISGCAIKLGINIPMLIKTDLLGNTSNVGINDHATIDRIRVYPNPATGFVVFEADALQSGTISVSDIYGREVAKVPITGEKTVWDTRGVRPGVYFYKVELNKTTSSGKILIMR